MKITRTKKYIHFFLFSVLTTGLSAGDSAFRNDLFSPEWEPPSLLQAFNNECNTPLHNQYLSFDTLEKSSCMSDETFELSQSPSQQQINCIGHDQSDKNNSYEDQITLMLPTPSAQGSLSFSPEEHVTPPLLILPDQEHSYQAYASSFDLSLTPLPPIRFRKRFLRSDELFTCSHEGCVYSTKDSSNLSRHIRIHCGEKPHKCSHDGCDFASVSSTGLIEHARTHSGEKPFKCSHESCDYATAKKGNLTVHMRKHTGEKPFKCTHEGCSFASITNTHLKYHLKSHSSETQTDKRQRT